MTVGLKLLLGVAFASNGCIAALLSINHGATLQVKSMMDEVLNIRNEIDADLRASIVQLQRQFMHLPNLFASDPTQAILREAERSFSIDKRIKLIGRDQYGPFYARTEKRDLAQGKFVADIKNNQLMLSHGLVDEQGKFTNVVEQLVLDSRAPEADLERIRTVIGKIMAKSGSRQFYEERIAALHALVADKSLEAEQSRTKILGFIDRINLQERRMRSAMDRQQNQNLYAGLATVCINILALFFLTRIIVERPLDRLANIVGAFGAGRYPEVSCGLRRDQIGVLYASMARFRTALLRLNREEQRKAEDRHKIEQLVRTMTETINGLDSQAAEMLQVALSLQELADQVEAATTDAVRLADDTTRHTVQVSNSSQQINAVVEDIYRELASQRGEINRFAHEIGQARQQLEGLNRSVGEIDTIVGTVRAITDQTKILAINATIEAVKAGNFGRGFAVVANEVKKLSQDTAIATGDVLDKIEAINRTCQAFITSFDSLDRGASALQQVTRTIDQSVKQQRSLTGAIVELSSATNENTLEVSGKIAEVNSAAANVLNLSRTTRHHAEEVATQLGCLLSGSVSDLGAMCDRKGQEQEPEPSTGCSSTAEQPESGPSGKQRAEQHRHLGLFHEQGILEGQ